MVRHGLLLVSQFVEFSMNGGSLLLPLVLSIEAATLPHVLAKGIQQLPWGKTVVYHRR